VLLDMRFNTDNKEVIGVGKSDIYFYSDGPKGFAPKKVIGWGPKFSQKQLTLSIGFMNNDIIVGAMDGKLLKIKGVNIVDSIQAHEGSVNSIYTLKKTAGVITGGSDGKVITWSSWSPKPQRLKTIDVLTLGDFTILNPRIRSVTANSEENVVAFVTRSSNILTVCSEGEVKQVQNGHFDRNLTDLCSVPRSNHVVTCGEDCMLAKWDVEKCKLIGLKKLRYMARTLDVSPDGTYMAVGCSNGFTIVLKAASLEEMLEITGRSKAITVVKFSPDGSLLAVASADLKIKVYGLPDFALVGDCSGHTAIPTEMDWSEAGDYLVSCDENLERIYWRTQTWKSIPHGQSELRDEKWSSWSCRSGFTIQGVYPLNARGNEVQSVCRNYAKNMVIVGDSYGKVKLFRYPASKKNANGNTFSGHSSPVVKVKFSSNEKYVLSIGGKDKTLIQWRVKVNAEEKDKVFLDSVKPTDIEVKAKKYLSIANNDPEQFLNLVTHRNEVDPTEEDEQKSAPSNFKRKPKGNEPPAASLTLKHVFGYRSFETKQTAFFLQDSNKVVFLASALGVVMDTQTMQQSFFQEHKEQLLAISISPCKLYCATAGLSGDTNSFQSDIYVWNVETLEVQKILTGVQTKGIQKLKFSPDGSLLASIGSDDDNSLAIYDWRLKRLICTSKVDKDPVFDIDWMDQKKLVTAGKRHIKFWQMTGTNIVAMKGIWGAFDAEALVSAQYGFEYTFTGSCRGTVASWHALTIIGSIQAHKGGVFAMKFDPSRSQLVTGGEEGQVKSWAMEKGVLTPLRVVYDFAGSFSMNPIVKVIDLHPDGSILLGDRASQLLRISPTGEENQFVTGHSDGELWALACDPQGSSFVTAGQDNTIRLWDTEKMAHVNTLMLNACITAIDWSKDGSFIVAGTEEGEILLFDKELSVRNTFMSSIAEEGMSIPDLKISPSMTYVAFGSNLGVSPIEILKIDDGRLESFKVIQCGISSGLKHLDWSEDSKMLVINSFLDELRYLNVESEAVLTPEEARDIEWAEWTLKRGFPVQGINGANVPGRDVRSVLRTHEKDLIITGDDIGNINLFRYPCTEKKSGCKKFGGHGSPVLKVGLISQDNFLVSIGGWDKSIMIWATDFGFASRIKGAFLEKVEMTTR
jgi:WD40 repeat protein